MRNNTRTQRRDRALVVAAKAPVAGTVKTRLCPPLSTDEAARLACALLADTLDTAFSPVVSAVADVFLALDGDEASVAATWDEAERRTPEGARLHRLRQRGNDLGERLAHLCADVFAAGYAHVCVIGGDTPDLPAAFLIEAFGRLAHGGQDGVVLGPAEDGGYYLVGLRQPAPGLFAGGIGWGGPNVLRDTLARAVEAERTVVLLPPWYDIDTIADLRRLREDLRRGSAHAPATASLLAILLPEKR